ncbi:hypothetical protein BASA81_002080 [Batrachochytrium salamandrivorans]|nr:hypothetical protein BASA81_002080 [Batrachochytrium salamandrivorans]
MDIVTLAKAIEYTQILPEEQRRCAMEVLLQSQVLAKKLADKEHQLVKLEAEKEKQLKMQAAALATINSLSDAVLKGKLKLEGELLLAKSQLRATEAMRPIVEILSKMAFPAATSTLSVQAICNSLVQGTKLNHRAQAWLNQLEGPHIDSKNVINELRDLYRELSKDHHYVDLANTPLPSGLVCGGKLPLRAAAALVVLEAQTLLANTPAGTLPREDIFYTNENGKQLHVLRRGTVV